MWVGVSVIGGCESEDRLGLVVGVEFIKVCCVGGETRYINVTARTGSVGCIFDSSVVWLSAYSIVSSPPYSIVSSPS